MVLTAGVNYIDALDELPVAWEKVAKHLAHSDVETLPVAPCRGRSGHGL